MTCRTDCPEQLRQLTAPDVQVSTTSPGVTGADAVRCPHGVTWWLTWPTPEPAPSAVTRELREPGPLRGARLLAVREDFAWLIDQGEHAEIAAARVGITAGTAADWQRLHRAGALLGSST